jgi:hypothetical protein
MKKVANDLSFGSLQGIAIHQEMVVRYLHKHGSGSDWLKAYTEAKIVLESLDRMVKDHPNFRTFQAVHPVFGGRLPSTANDPRHMGGS